MNASTETAPAVRCVQCGWTVPPRNLDDAFDQVTGELIPLHRGGCPTPDPLTGRIEVADA